MRQIKTLTEDKHKLQGINNQLRGLYNAVTELQHVCDQLTMDVQILDKRMLGFEGRLQTKGLKQYKKLLQRKGARDE